MIGLRSLMQASARGGLTAAFIALSAFSALPAQARSLEDAERAALATTVNEFNAAMTAENYERVIATVPPRVIKSIGDKVGMKSDEITKQMIELMKTMKDTVQITSFSMDISKAEYKEAKNGTPFALIPTTTNMKMADGDSVVAKSHTLGMMDEGKWYLLRVADAAQIVILKEVYPDFAGIESPTGTMEFQKQ